jgi:hypothetical protein
MPNSNNSNNSNNSKNSNKSNKLKKYNNVDITKLKQINTIDDIYKYEKYNSKKYLIYDTQKQIYKIFTYKKEDDTYSMSDGITYFIGRNEEGFYPIDGKIYDKSRFFNKNRTITQKIRNKFTGSFLTQGNPIKDWIPFVEILKENGNGHRYVIYVL